MTTRRVRTAIALTTGLLIVVAPLVTACGNAAESAIENAAGEAIGGDVDIDGGNVTVTQSDGTEVQVGDNVSIPDSWPSEVPVYDGGKLMTVTVDGNASRVNAMWQTDEAAEDAIATYGAALTSAGYTSDTTNQMGDVNTAEFVGNGYTVTLLAIAVDGTTTLTVVAEKS